MERGKVAKSSHEQRLNHRRQTLLSRMNRVTIGYGEPLRGLHIFPQASPKGIVIHLAKPFFGIHGENIKHFIIYD